MLHLRLFDNSLYYTLASVSSGMLLPPQASNSSSSSTAGSLPVEAAVNLTYFTPAISHVMLAPTATIPSNLSAPQTSPTAATTMTTATATATAAAAAAAAATTTASAATTAAPPGSDFQAAAAAAAAGGNLTSPHAAEMDNLNSFYFYEVSQWYSI